MKSRAHRNCILLQISAKLLGGRPRRTSLGHTHLKTCHRRFFRLGDDVAPYWFSRAPCYFMGSAFGGLMNGGGRFFPTQAAIFAGAALGCSIFSRCCGRRASCASLAGASFSGHACDPLR